MTYLAIALALLVGAPKHGQEPADRFWTELDPFVEALVADWEIPGLAYGIVSHGDLVHARALGRKSIAGDEPITTRSLFHMASVSKTFVAVSVLQLVEQGRIDLDAPIVHYLEDFRMDDERLSRVTVRMMLQHTSGIPDTADYGWDRPEHDVGALARYVRGLSDLALDFDPGTDWAYSNIAYEVLGHLIATVSGETFEDYVERHVLRPVGMTTSTFLPDEADPDLRVVGHVWDLEPVVAPVYPYNRAHAPSSTLHSSVEEMALWMRVHLARGDLGTTRLLQARTHDEMWRAGPVTGIDGQRMGLGWFQGHVRGHETWGHRGGDVGFRTWMELVPDASIGVVVLSNSSQGPGVRLVAEAALDVALGFGTGRVPVPMLHVFARTLRSEGVEAAIDQYLELRATRPGDFLFRTEDLLDIGSALVEHERVAEAREVFALAVDQDPRSARALACLGGAQRLLGEDELAASCLRESLALDPADARARQALEELERLLGETIPCVLANRQVHVPVTVDGRGPYWFIVDTGASVAGCIDRSLVEALGLESSGELTVGDGSGVGDVVLPVVRARIATGTTELGDLELLVDDYRRPMGPGTSEDGERIRLGILGLDAFWGQVLTVDARARTVRLRPGAGLEGSTEHDVPLPEDMGPGDDLVVPVRIGAFAFQAVVDTGSASALTLPSAWRDRVETVGEPRVVGQGRTRMNTYEVVAVTPARPVQLAGHVLEDQELTFNDHHSVAILGMGILERFRLTLDLAGHRMRFEPAGEGSR